MVSGRQDGWHDRLSVPVKVLLVGASRWELGQTLKLKAPREAVSVGPVSIWRVVFLLYLLDLLYLCCVSTGSV